LQGRKKKTFVNLFHKRGFYESFAAERKNVREEKHGGVETGGGRGGLKRKVENFFRRHSSLVPYTEKYPWRSAWTRTPLINKVPDQVNGASNMGEGKKESNGNREEVHVA